MMGCTNSLNKGPTGTSSTMIEIPQLAAILSAILNFDNLHEQ